MGKRAPAIASPKASRAGLSTRVTAPQKQRARRILELTGASTKAMIEVGRLVLAAKAELKHSAFANWVKQDLDMSTREASRLERVATMADLFGDHDAALGALSIDALQRLAARTVPDSVRTEVLRRLEAHEPVRSHEVLTMVRDAAKTERQRRKAEREERLAHLPSRERTGEDARRTEISADQSAPNQPSQDEVARAAADVTGRIGADVLASLAERYGDATWPALNLAIGLAIAERQRQGEVIELSVSEIDCGESQDPDASDQVSDDDAALNMAERIEAGDPVPSIIVARDHDGRYNLTEGYETFKAYAMVLQRPTVPVCIARPIDVAADTIDVRSA